MSLVHQHLATLRKRADELVAEGKPFHSDRQNDSVFQFNAILLVGVHMEELEALVSDAPARDWPEDFGQENGQYQNVCAKCRQTFMGHKRRPLCKVCAPAAGVKEDAAPQRESWTDALANHAHSTTLKALEAAAGVLGMDQPQQEKT